MPSGKFKKISRDLVNATIQDVSTIDIYFYESNARWMEQFYRAVGCLLREKREKLGLSHEKLADQLNLSRTSVTNIEAGNQRILLHHAIQLSRTLQVTMEELRNALDKVLIEEELGKLSEHSRAIANRSLELARKKGSDEPRTELAY